MKTIRDDGAAGCRRSNSRRYSVNATQSGRFTLPVDDSQRRDAPLLTRGYYTLRLTRVPRDAHPKRMSCGMSAAAASPNANRLPPSATRPSAWMLPMAAGLVASSRTTAISPEGHSFFSADEAVEGLMARHLGELPVFFWGSGPQGRARGVHRWRGVCDLWRRRDSAQERYAGRSGRRPSRLLVRLTERWHGRTAATIAALLLVTGPAAVVDLQPGGHRRVRAAAGGAGRAAARLPARY